MSDSPALKVLLDRFREADAEHCRRIDLTDAALERGEPTEEMLQSQYEACEISDAIALEICGYPPRSADEAAAKVAFLREWWTGISPEHHEVMALLSSMAVEGPELTKAA